MRIIENKEDFAVALGLSYDKPVLILKTSNVCSLSLRTYNNFKDLESRFPSIKEQVFVLVVQDVRDISDDISSRFGVTHESPQALVMANEDLVYYESHEKIDLPKIEQILKKKSSIGFN